MFRFRKDPAAIPQLVIGMLVFAAIIIGAYNIGLSHMPARITAVIITLMVGIVCLALWVGYDQRICEINRCINEAEEQIKRLQPK